jgi:(2Fe-2S) ferredoxin
MSVEDLLDDEEKLRKLAPVALAPVRRHVLVCEGKSCRQAGAEDVKDRFEKVLAEKGLRFGKESKGRNPEGPVVLTDCGSVGFCSVGPAVLVYPEGVWYARVTPDDVPEIVLEHLENGRAVERLALIRDFGDG